MDNQERIWELREKIVEILTEPDVSGIDWNLGYSVLAVWKANLPDEILNLIKEAGYLKVRGSCPHFPGGE